MKSDLPGNAQTVVVGGGIAGCSVLYHLAQLGWTDTVLVERDELTSGSTWHAAAQVTQFGGNQTMVALKQHSIKLYKMLADDPDHPFYYHITGGMRTAYHAEQLDTYHHYVSQARGMGADMEVIDGAEAGKRHPLLTTDDIIGAWWDPLDGYIDPAGLTFALARKAREAGAIISRSNATTAITKHADRDFTVHTELGDIRCECVVNACGYRVNEVGAMLGVSHPVVSMEHMYFLTNTIDELTKMDQQVPIIRDPKDDFYSRQEKHGLLVGVYEQDCKTFGIDGIDPSFTRELCPSDLDRCLPNIEHIINRMPVLADTGIHTVINGPITYTIDGLPLIGPVPGIPGYYACTGLRAGIGEGGGHGKILAEIMVHGESEWDAWCLDPRRFTNWANTEHTRLKAIEDYQREFHYHLPHEHRPAARQARTTPLYDRLNNLGAAWGVVNGWERALYFESGEKHANPVGYRFHDTHRTIVGREVHNVMNNVGMMEVSGFTRIDVRGNGAHDMLDQLTCGRLPQQPGDVRLCYLLNHHGHLLAEATVAKLGDEHYWYGSAAASEWHDLDWLSAYKPAGVTLTELTQSHTTLVIAGPRSRALLSGVAPRNHWDVTRFGWMKCNPVQIGHADAIAMSVSFSGELAWELHIPNQHLLHVFTTLQRTGNDHDLALFGLDATESMRLEKGYCHFKAEIISERNPFEAALERFVDMTKAEFIGKAALVDTKNRAQEKQLVTLTVDSSLGAAPGGASIYQDDDIIGTVTSGAYGYRIDQNLALAYINGDDRKPGREISVDLLGERVPCSVADPCLYDPLHEKVRM